MSEHFGKEFAEEHAEELRKFLVEARQHGCNYGEPVTMRSSDGEQVQLYASGNWEYRDAWYGGEPYAGMTTIKYQGKVCWVMTYWGEVHEGVDKQIVYECLKAALKAFDPELPARGPAIVPLRMKNGTIYSNNCYGNIKKFFGDETIAIPSSVSQIGEVVYEMNYFGGFVDLR